MMDLPVPESRIILRPEDVPGALLQEHIEIADHSKLQLQRWLECRSLKKTGTKSELVQRVIDCIQAGRKDQIFLGIDNGKWYDLKRNTITNPTSSVVPAATTITTNWKKFPSCSIPKYFNKGYIYSYLVGTRFETEDYEVHYDEAGITEKPFRRGTQFVGKIKCPKTLENKDPNLFEEVLTKSQKNAFFAFKEDGQTKLKSNHPYLYQVVTSMLVFEVPICDFVVWSNINILVFQVKLEKIETIVIDNILIKLKKVYYNMYIPELFLMKVPRNLTVFELE
ncbi:hypothetical protein FQR65_LT13779 [Abscondita terminalis]|nr:hypothetical protein FQR65_LT13779 [Abscondita terminalis]